MLICLFPLQMFSENAPLRIFIRAGEKTHGEGEHDHPRFLNEWQKLLRERGAQCIGKMGFPSRIDLENTDVLVMYCAEGGTVTPENRTNLEAFVKRGGGIVVLHDAICGTDAQWFKTIVGGAWEHGRSKWFEGDIALYYVDRDHPITKDASNFDFEDELYYDLHMMPEAHVLAATYKPDERNNKGGKMFPSVYDIVPQMWTYEKDNHRAFVSIPGHKYKSFSLPHYRAMLLRGIAWAGKRDVNSLCTKEELASLRYPEGGPTSPENSAQKIKVPKDFDINLVSAEPLIEKPISMDWDAQGRLWVAETPEYPAGRHNPEGQIEQRPARDRISILEDSNGDGVMDKKSVFYEGLELVTSLVFYRDGVIVSQAPDIYWLRDTNGDGKAETKVTLYTGFGTRDTHAVISNMRWSQDGWIYATLGYSGGGIKSGDGKHEFGGLSSGVIRFSPDGNGMEQVSSKNGNTWGLDFSWDNELFFSQANGEHCNHVVIPEQVLARGKVAGATSFKNLEDHKKSFPIRDYTKQAYVQIDHVGGFTAASGATIYNGGAWPTEWDGSYFVSEPTVNLVHRDLLKPQGPTFVGSKDQEAEFIASSDLWFRPIHQRVGPDGALYLLDFYNQAVVHNDTRGPKHGPNNAAVRPDRDHHFGRIWRVQHKQANKFEIPKLAKASPDELIKALEHPNEWVRMTAHRLLAERNQRDVVPALEQLVASTKPAFARVHALWLLENIGACTHSTITAGLNDPDPAVQKNAAQILARLNNLNWNMDIHYALIRQFQNPNPRVQLQAIIAEYAFKPGKPAEDMLISIFPNAQNPWTQSAILAAATKDPVDWLESICAVEPAGLDRLVSELASHIAAKQEHSLTAATIARLGLIPAKGDAFKKIVLQKLAAELDPKLMLPWSPTLQQFLQAIVASPDPEVGAAAIPLIARWDKDGVMAQDVRILTEHLIEKMNAPASTEEQRLFAATSLLGVRNLNPQILPTVLKLVGSTNSVAMQKKLIEALGKTGEPSVSVEFISNYASLPAELRDAVFNELVKRPEWALVLLDVIASKKIELSSLSPLSVNRLRTHSDKAVAQKANEVIDALRGPEVKQKDEIIARLLPAVTESQSANVENGHKLFIQNCAVCHRFNGEGKDVAPDLTGMGVHGASELLVHVIDPNRVVEPNFISTSIETKDDQSYDGIIARENSDSVLLRNASGDYELKRKNIKTQKSTGRSLMPEGFESLGAESLRDILTFVCGKDNQFRIINLRPAFTANSLKGIYRSEESVEETLKFARFGVFKFSEMPFEIVNPLTSPNGKNVVVLKGGEGLAKSYPQKVEVKNVNVRAAALHFLGGVAGWGWPCCGDNKNGGLPAAKVTITHTNGSFEEFTLTNGLEIADYNGNFNVPGSKPIPGLVEHGQVRWFTKMLSSQEMISSIKLESFDNAVAPTFVAITAETVGPPPSQTARKAPVDLGHPVERIEDLNDFFPASYGPISIFMLGGGTSHDFDRWFNVDDSTTLAYATDLPVNYTTNIDYFISQKATNCNVLYLCSNQPMTNNVFRQSFMDFANRGGGLLLIHPALWYNWNNWPEYNRMLVSGGARSHDKYGEIEVTIEDRKHPVMINIPKGFKVSDELYHFEPDPQGPTIHVLATGKNPATGATFPVVWTVDHPKARIVCITLGHDRSAHENVAFRVMLQNAMAWVARKL